MSDPEKTKTEARPESPTTAKALDFDDDATDVPSSPPSKTATATSNLRPGSGEDGAPPKPPRPLSPQQQAESTLKDAFPAIETSVIKAVLRASGGRVEPAFNALLGMSDPDAAEAPPPPQPPRRQRSPQQPSSTEHDQLAADERYARQLAEHYNGVDSHGFAPRRQYPTQSRRQPRPIADDDDDREHSFFDDDLPVIRENIKKGFLETQSTVNKWVTNLKKKIDGEDEDDFQSTPAAPAQGYTHQNTYSGRRSSEFGRRSTDRDRYDADPPVLGDDFSSLQLHDNDGLNERRSSRPTANPNLFKPTPARPHSGSNRRVSFQDGPPEEIDIHYPKSPSPINRPSSGGGGKNSKWQPMAAVEPSPVAEHDPFSLGDSDDEEAKKKDVKADDSERLKHAAAEAMAGNIGGEGKKLEAHERSGSLGQNDKETEDLLTKTS